MKTIIQKLSGLDPVISNELPNPSVRDKPQSCTEFSQCSMGLIVVSLWIFPFIVQVFLTWTVKDVCNYLEPIISKLLPHPSVKWTPAIRP